MVASHCGNGKRPSVGSLGRLRTGPLAVRTYWPGTLHLIGWDRLRRRLLEADDSAIRQDRRHGVYDPLAQAANDALESRREWPNFRAWAHQQPRAPHVLAWIRHNGPVVRRQLRLGRYWPADTGPLEQKLAEVRDMFYRRKGLMRNRDRTNRLLMLVTLHENQQNNTRQYARLIREYLAGRSGRAPRHNLINRSPRLH